MTSSSDANLQPTSYQYKNDASFWRPDNVTDALSNVTGFTYTPPTPTTPAQTESVLTFGSSTVDVLATLDSLGRAQFLQRKQGPTSTYYDTVYSTYDSLGRPYSTTVPYQGTAKQTGGSGSTITTYDALSRPTAIQDGGGALLNFTYSLNDVYREVAPKPASDNNTKRRNLEYDGLGRLTSVCEVTSASGDTYWGACNQKVPYNGYLTTYTYDVAPNYNSVSVVQNAQKGTSQTRSYVYDMIGRLTYESNPETGATYYYYDTSPTGSLGATCAGTYSGDLVKKYDAQGNTICYTYDALHRLTSVTYPAGPNSAASLQKNFVYDAASASGFSLTNAKGRLSEAYTGTSSSKQTDLVFSYSARGEVTDTWESTPHSSGYYHISQAYWANGAVKTLNSFLGMPTISYGVDGEGRIANATASTGQNPASLISYNTSVSPVGAVSQVTFGSGDYDTYTYIPATGRFQKYTFNVGSPAQTVKGALTWNTNGTINNLVISDQFNASDSQTCLYSYDDLGRVATANCGPLSNQTFTFDPFGNVTKNATAGTAFVPTYNLSKNQYSSVPSCSPAGGPSYDLNGNPTNDCEHAYTYNAQNQPVSIDTSNTFVYDALGRMVETVYTGGNTEYIYAPTGEELALANGQTLQKAMIRLPGGGEAVYKIVSGSVAISHYRHGDWSGSARFSSTPSQTLYYDVAYAPYGETYAALIGSGGNNSVVFAGQGKDTTTDLYPFLFRQYNSIQSRWVWPDPAGLGAVDQTNPQTLNRYAYVGNTPLTAVDPLGLQGRAWGSDSGGLCIDPFSCSITEINGLTVSGSAFGGFVLGQGGSGLEFAFAPGSGIGPATSGSLGELGSWQPQWNPSTFKEDPATGNAHVTTGYWSLVWSAANNTPFSVSVYLPVAYGVGGYTYTYTHIAAKGQPTYNCSSHSGTISTPAAKVAVSGGPLTLFGQSTQNAQNVISSWGWNFSLQAFPWLGYQVNINSSGVVGGFTFGVPGASASYGWGSCTRGD